MPPTSTHKRHRQLRLRLSRRAASVASWCAPHPTVATTQMPHSRAGLGRQQIRKHRNSFRFRLPLFGFSLASLMETWQLLGLRELLRAEGLAVTVARLYSASPGRETPDATPHRARSRVALSGAHSLLLIAWRCPQQRITLVFMSVCIRVSRCLVACCCPVPPSIVPPVVARMPPVLQACLQTRGRASQPRRPPPTWGC